MADESWASTMYGSDTTPEAPAAAPPSESDWAGSMYKIDPPPKLDEPSQTPPAKDAQPPTDPNGKPAEPPESYELSLPEGVAIDPEINTELQAALKEAKLAPDQAKKLVDLHVKTVQAQQAQFEKTLETWSNETMTTLGDTAPEVFGHAKAALERFDKQGKIRELLDASGLGNRLEVVRLFEQIGRELASRK